MMTAASLSFAGASPLAEISACWPERQLSLLAICAPVESKTFRTGSARAPLTPVEGPKARTMTRLVEPVRLMNPAMPSFWPPWTLTRVAMLARRRRGGVGTGVAPGATNGGGYGVGVGGGATAGEAESW